MHHCSTNTLPRQGLYVLDARLQALAAKDINWRECRLLALIDQGANGYKARQGERKRPKSIFRTTGELHRRLGYGPGNTTQPVQKLLSSLKKKGYLKYRSAGWALWEIKTAVVTDERGIYIPPLVEELFLDGRLTVAESFVLSHIVAFTLDGLLFYASNRTIGKRFGIKTARVSRILSSLARKGFVTIEVMTQNDLYETLDAHEANNHRGCTTYRPKAKSRNGRIVWPTFEEAYSRKADW